MTKAAAGEVITVQELHKTGRDTGISPAAGTRRFRRKRSSSALLGLWDRVTGDIDALWPEIPEGRFREFDKAFGDFEGPVWSHVFYFIDNEIHHRGQGYAYLRALDVEPPYFWERCATAVTLPTAVQVTGAARRR